MRLICILLLLTLASCTSPFDLERRLLERRGDELSILIEYPHASGLHSEAFNELILEKTEEKIGKFTTDMSDYRIYGERTLVGDYEVWEWNDSIIHLRQHFQGTIPKSYDRQMNYFEEVKFDVSEGRSVGSRDNVDGVRLEK